MAGLPIMSKSNLSLLKQKSLNRKIRRIIYTVFTALLVPGGFGERGAEGKIKAIQFARENKVPYFGICFGMQMAVIEAARNLCGIKGANSTEFGPCDIPIVDVMREWVKDNQVQERGQDIDLGGTMRLGAYPATLGQDTLSGRDLWHAGY